MKKAFKLYNILNYGKFIAWCINHDISVYRLYWDERKAGTRCYEIDLKMKKVYYSDEKYYLDIGYEIVDMAFSLDKYGSYHIENL